MYLYSLDKKKMTVSQKFSKIEFADLLMKNNITTEQLINEIQKQLYTQFSVGCAKNIRTAVVENDNEVLYTVSGYILNEDNLKELVREILELSDEDKQKYLDEIKTIPTYVRKDIQA